MDFPLLLVIDSHTETAPPLRIDKPFKELYDYAMSIDFESLDDMEHGHIPYVVILVRAMNNWKAKVCVFLLTYSYT